MFRFVQLFCSSGAIIVVGSSLQSSAAHAIKFSDNKVDHDKCSDGGRERARGRLRKTRRKSNTHREIRLYCIFVKLKNMADKT